jgi:Protein of unknown function (DUF3489)
MTTFTINDQNEIVAFATSEEATATTPTPFDSFNSEQQLAELAGQWPGSRLMEIWNTLPGVTPLKKFKDHNTAIRRIWARIQHLGGNAEPETQPETPKVERTANSGRGAAKGTSAKPKSRKAPSRVKKSAREAGAPREGSKTAQVVAMLQRKNGATISEIVDKMGWQKHTVRGFMAGAMKKAGYTVESFKPEGGERTYRLPK